MKQILCMFALLLSLSNPLFAQGNNCAKDVRRGMQFIDVILKPGCEYKNEVRYSFFIDKIYCGSPNFESGGQVSWPFNGSLYTSTMPIVLKKTNNAVEKHFKSRLADLVGMLTVTVSNNTNKVKEIVCIPWWPTELRINAH